jgi:amino acid transporter
MILTSSALLALLPLASTTAFIAITQTSTICAQASYAVPIYLRLTASKDRMEQNPGFSLGSWSILLGWLAFGWLAFASLILLLPTERDPVLGITRENFNYTPVMMALMLAFVIGYWHLPKEYGGAKHVFFGPKRKNEETFIKGKPALPSDHGSGSLETSSEELGGKRRSDIDVELYA